MTPKDHWRTTEAEIVNCRVSWSRSDYEVLRVLTSLNMFMKLMGLCTGEGCIPTIRIASESYSKSNTIPQILFATMHRIKRFA